jgi:peroxiredoxin
MAQFESRKDDLEQAKVQLVFIAAEKRGGVFRPEKFLSTHPVAFPFLLDEDRRVTKAYGVYQRLGSDALNIARPASFVIDREGIIRFVYVGRSQHDRASLAEVVSTAAKV